MKTMMNSQTECREWIRKEVENNEKHTKDGDVGCIWRKNKRSERMWDRAPKSRPVERARSEQTPRNTTGGARTGWSVGDAEKPHRALPVPPICAACALLVFSARLIRDEKAFLVLTRCSVYWRARKVRRAGQRVRVHIWDDEVERARGASQIALTFNLHLCWLDNTTFRIQHGSQHSRWGLCGEGGGDFKFNTYNDCHSELGSRKPSTKQSFAIFLPSWPVTYRKHPILYAKFSGLRKFS